MKEQPKLSTRIIPLAEAKAFVGAVHRHHKPPVGHRFSLGCFDGSDTLRGVAIVGRPVARKTDHLTVVEVTRLATDGCPNACSCLYQASARLAKKRGFATIQTFILASEPGTSLKASGWTMGHTVKGRQWKHSDGKPRRTDQPTCDKVKWYRLLRAEQPGAQDDEKGKGEAR